MGKSNLFALDLDATLGALAEANLDLALGFGRVLAARARLPPALGTSDDVDRARRLARDADAFRARCRATRLEDTRPLRTFAAKVDDFFKDMEGGAAQARDEAVDLLTEAGRRPTTSVPLASAHSDQPSSGATGVDTATLPTAPAVAAPIPMAWTVEGVDRDHLDLEALRPFLTDATLLAAARAHLKAHEPHTLAGASYARTALPW